MAQDRPHSDSEQSHGSPGRDGASASSGGDERRAVTGGDDRPLVLVTGAAGNLGRSVGKALSDAYRIVGIDRAAGNADFPVLEADITSDESMAQVFAQLREQHGRRIASVIHLVAFFDFSGEPNPLYQSVNVDGTRRLLRELRDFDVEQFVYASTMLVHAACQPGERIDEGRPIAPAWEYPKSKAAAEAVIREEHGSIPYVLLRLAGVYDEESTVPTMAQQSVRSDRVRDEPARSGGCGGSQPVGQVEACPHRGGGSASGGVDATGIGVPGANGRLEFWRRREPVAVRVGEGGCYAAAQALAYVPDPGDRIPRSLQP
jgi:hypothetical protein